MERGWIGGNSNGSGGKMTMMMTMMMRRSSMRKQGNKETMKSGNDKSIHIRHEREGSIDEHEDWDEDKA